MATDPASPPPGGPGGGLVRFITCGSVDDGKSTLIGRLLFEAQLLHTDAMEALARDSRRHGTTGGDIDFALLVDGLEAEREQGITIDVAYRFFATPRRAFIVADTPGHEQYTRNMATGASTADLAVLLVDARKGLLPQTRRHALICSLFGIRRVILAVNKMDLVGFSQEIFADIAAAFRAFAADLGFETLEAVPLSARHGDNIVAASPSTPWHAGPTLIEALERSGTARDAAALPFRLPVQWVNRPSADFRGFSGTLAGGRLAVGDAVVVAASGRTSRVAGILGPDGPCGEAVAGDAVTVTLADALDVARGDLLAAPQARPHVGDQFAAHLLWIGEEHLLPGRPYLMRIGTRWVGTSVTAIKHRIDVNTGARLAAKTLALNEIGVCNLATAAPVAFDDHAENRETGSFILVDRTTDATVAAGLIDFPLRRATNIHRESLAVDKAARAARRGQKPCIVWFTGLSGSGKSTLARLLEQRLFAAGRDTYMLDGDNLRHGLNRDLGFTEADRVENIRRVGEVGKLFVDAGLIVLCAFISPYAADRRMVRDLVGEDEFVEVFVDAPLATCAARDPKGLYAKARAGLMKNFTGIDAPYEAPTAPELHLETDGTEPDALVDRLLADLAARGRLD